MANYLSPFSSRQFIDANGNPYSGAKLFTYVAGSTTKVTTYKDEAGSSAHANPIVLNTRGEPADGSAVTYPVWQIGSAAVKFVLAPSTDTDPPGSPIATWDNIDGINDTSITVDQWITGPTPTYVGATSFTLVGDQTSTFHIGRRIKTTNSGGTIYSTISVSAYGALTTITVVNDSGTLDSGLSAVSYGVLSATNHSVPVGATLAFTGNNTHSGTNTHTGSETFSNLNVTLGGTGNVWSTGDVKLTLKTTSDSGWVIMNDGTIGNAASGGTTRANADTVSLYTLLWTNILDAWAPVSTGRGASAAADYAANKTITLPRMLGRALAISGTGATLTARVLGGYLGAETHTLITAEMPAHTHNIDSTFSAAIASGTSTAGASAGTVSGSTGGGGAHNNMQPSSFLNVMIKL